MSTAKKRRGARDWKCQECGKLMTLAGAERASSEGCTRCGSTDMDLSEAGVAAWAAEVRAGEREQRFV